LPFLHSSQMNSDDLALPARCPMSLAAGGRVIPPIGAVVMASTGLKAMVGTGKRKIEAFRPTADPNRG
jgi:hypothetical protein